MFKQKDDEAEEQVVDSWEGEGSLNNLGYYVGKHIEANASIRIHVEGKKKVKLRRIK